MMHATFFNSQTTPLFSSSWVPSTTGQYAGTCIFLILFAALYHALGTFRKHWVHKLQNKERQRRIVIVDGSDSKNDGNSNGMIFHVRVPSMGLLRRDFDADQIIRQ